jgi:ABC-type phosphate/phosphonate transport system substrate-binding protein
MLLSALAEACSSSIDLQAPFKVPSVLLTGSHNASVHAVRQGCCDLAAIDCVSLALGMLHHPSFLDGVRIIGWTKPAFALPFVTHKHVSESTLQSIRGGMTNSHVEQQRYKCA